MTPTASGWQMSCTNPNHRGGKTCQKTRSSAALGEDVTLRMLKWWAVSGATLTEHSQESHFKHFEKILRDTRAGALPSDEQLEEMKISRW